jgi:hypothetical protein
MQLAIDHIYITSWHIKILMLAEVASMMESPKPYAPGSTDRSFSSYV